MVAPARGWPIILRHDGRHIETSTFKIVLRESLKQQNPRKETEQNKQDEVGLEARPDSVQNSGNSRYPGKERSPAYSWPLGCGILVQMSTMRFILDAPAVLWEMEENRASRQLEPLAKS